MSATMATSLANGFSSRSSEHINEVQEYEKILKLRDEIFAGTHPRLGAHAHANRKVSPLSAANTSAPPSFSSTIQQPQLPGLSLHIGEEKRGIEQDVNNHTTSLQLKPTTASGIDPVLLMKSDELVKAETHLHRQRLEKALRDQFEQKRLDARKKPAAGEAKPDFDVAAVLSKSQEVAKPDGAPTPKDDASNSDTYDENSLYSSRAPDSTPDVGELEDSASSQNQNQSGASFGANGPAESHARVVQNAPPIVPLPQIKSPIVNSRKASGAVDLSILENDDDDEEEEEGEYSPPEAVEETNISGDPSSQHVVDPRSRPLRRYSELDENSKRPGSPGDHVRIVRNHILSPIAPQPSRVSPLAVTKDPLFSQNTRSRTGRHNRRGDQSPDGPGQALNPPRKKRKLDKKGKRRNGGSPDIKDEPVSPPPFHDVQPLGSGRARPIQDDRPIVIVDEPMHEIRYVQAPDQYLNSPLRPLSRQADPMMPLTEPRAISRSAVRPMRDDTDLRRVASMHNLRAEQPRDYVEPIYDSPTRVRAASYMRVDSPMRLEAPRLVQDLPQQAYEREAPQASRVARSPAPMYRQVYQEPEPQVRYLPEPMPSPATETIIVDSYGRRFREIIQDRGSVAPHPYSPHPDRGQSAYYDSYDRGRGQSVVIETRQDARLGQEMPPPQMVRPVAGTPLGYREVYEPLPPQRSGSVRPVEASPRQPIYVDERPEYRAPVRVESVRPTGPRYEEMPPPMAARAGSVRPGAREGSVFVDDRSQMRREYLPVATPRYRVVEPRYIDAQGREITYVDGGSEMAPRYVQRY